MIRVKYKDFYDGRLVQLHYIDDNRIFKIVKVDYTRGFHLAEELFPGHFGVRFKIEEEYYEMPTNHGLWETETTIRLNRENKINELLNDSNRR